MFLSSADRNKTNSKLLYDKNLSKTILRLDEHYADKLDKLPFFHNQINKGSQTAIIKIISF